MFSSRSLTWLMPFGLVVFAMLSVPLRILSEEGLPRYRRLKDQLTRMQGDNVALERDIERLKRDVDMLLHDPDTIERIARDELGLIGKDEVLFEFAPEAE
jgi:cell division protein FtsB